MNYSSIIVYFVNFQVIVGSFDSNWQNWAYIKLFLVVSFKYNFGWNRNNIEISSLNGIKY